MPWRGGGQSAEAAALYQEAARTAEGEERVRLSIWGAQHLLQSAQVKQGLESARALLTELGMGLPRGETAAIARIVWDRTRIGIRGLALKPVAEKGIDSRTALQLEAAWQLSAPLAVIDVLPSANLSAAHLQRALNAGDRAHAARALAQEATMRSVQKPLVESNYLPLLERSRKLADQVGDPALDAFVSWVEGMIAIWRLEPPRALGPLRRAEQMLREQCPDEPWLLTNVRTTLGGVLFVLGEHRSQAQQCRAWLTEAREREDRFAETALFGAGGGFLRHLMADDPSSALAELDQTMAAWPREPFSSSGGGELNAVALIEGYRGGAGFQRWLERERTRLDRALLLKTPFMKLTLMTFSATAKLGAVSGSSGDERSRLLRDIHRDIVALKRDPRGLPSALVLEAQLLALAGSVERAAQCAASAVRAFDALGVFNRHGAAYLQGLLEGGDRGRERREAAVAFFLGQGWIRPERALAMMVPVLSELEAR